MKSWNKCIIGALTGLGLASAAHAYGPVPGQAPLTAVPGDFKLCAADGKICKPAAGATQVYVVYGEGSKFGTAQGTGDFTCLPKGFVKFPSASSPADLGIDDPSPKVAKSCYIKTVGGSAPASTPAASSTPAATAQKPTTSSTTTTTTTVATAPLLAAGCNAYKGEFFNAAAKQYSSMALLNANYYKIAALTESNVNAAATACAKQCGATGEPAPCAWFSVTKWLNTVGGKDAIGYVCHMFNDRSLHQITTPNLPIGDNLGTASSPARFQEAHSYACRT